MMSHVARLTAIASDHFGGVGNIPLAVQVLIRESQAARVTPLAFQNSLKKTATTGGSPVDSFAIAKQVLGDKFHNARLLDKTMKRLFTPEALQSPIAKTGIRRIAQFVVAEKPIDSLEAAQRYSEMSHDAAVVDSLLPRAIDPEGRFTNGHGYIPHTAAAITAFKAALRAAILKWHGEKWAAHFDQNPKGVIGRYLSDSVSPLYRSLSRLDCIDSVNREWGQPSIVSYPELGRLTKWKKTGTPTQSQSRDIHIVELYQNKQGTLFSTLDGAKRFQNGR